MAIARSGSSVRKQRSASILRLSRGLLHATGLAALLALAYLLARLPLGLAAVLVLGATGAVMLLLRPTWGLYLLAFTIPFGSLFSVRVAGAALGPSELVLAAMLISWLLRMAAAKQIRWSVPNVGWALLFYCGAATLSLLNISSLTAALPELLKWAEVWLLMIFVTNVVKPKERLALCFALLLAGSLQAALGIYQFLWRVGPEGFMLMGGRTMRAYGTFEQPNPFGGYLGLLLPLAYGLILVFWRNARHKTWRPNMFVARSVLWLALAAASLMLTGLVMSWSRGALLGLACGVALVGLALGKRTWLVAAMLLPLLVLLTPELLSLAPAGFVERMLDTARYVGQDLTVIEITDESFSVVERAAHWQAAWRMFSMRPWLGVGIGQYATIYPQVAVPRWQDPLGHAHNIYLHLLAEGGLLGLMTHLIFLATWLCSAFSQAWHARGLDRAIALGALGMLGHLLAHNLVDNLYVHGMYLMMAILLGLLAIPQAVPASFIPEQQTDAANAQN